MNNEPVMIWDPSAKIGRRMLFVSEREALEYTRARKEDEPEYNPYIVFLKEE